ncbi:class B sortase [Senegalia massiliensis]|uniref:SrtB family sortase n=1 Tax=Senegalia massiliensis TaxID=1720316 RepID=A0A845QVM1_9CLOT|nr:class B sortase [Senegalia massiliensis]NBI06575.1 SrtB family sortase [Senegalia massiliensis]
MIRKVIIVISLIILLISSYNIGSYIYDSISNKKLYKETVSKYETLSKDNDKNNSDIGTNPFKKINENMVGWIEVPNTNIDYPIVKGKDNFHYLYHNIEDEKSIHGSIFMDYRNKNWDDKNTIIYGHHMKDGTMFKELTKYKNKDFFDNNDSFYIDTGSGKIEYKILSVNVFKGDSNYIRTNFNSSEEFLDYIGYIKKESLFHRDLELKTDEDIITLSTCSYEFDDARTVVYGIKK